MNNKRFYDGRSDDKRSNVPLSLQCTKHPNICLCRHKQIHTKLRNKAISRFHVCFWHNSCFFYKRVDIIHTYCNIFLIFKLKQYQLDSAHLWWRICRIWIRIITFSSKRGHESGVTYKLRQIGLIVLTDLRVYEPNANRLQGPIYNFQNFTNSTFCH